MKIDLEYARGVIASESEAIKGLAKVVGASFARAAEMIYNCTGSCIVSGIGKAGIIGQKISATLASTGTPSHFLHPAEAVHGDLGRLRKEDIVIVLSYGGETDEVTRLIQGDIDAGTFTGSVYVRSAIDSERDAEALRFITVFEDAGATTATAGAYSSWPPNPDSPLLALMTQVYTDLFGTAPEATAVHAGLETSVAGVKYPDMDMISIGPTLRDVHTPNERLEVASVPKVYDLIVAALAEVK